MNCNESKFKKIDNILKYLVRKYEFKNHELRSGAWALGHE